MQLIDIIFQFIGREFIDVTHLSGFYIEIHILPVFMQFVDINRTLVHKITNIMLFNFICFIQLTVQLSKILIHKPQFFLSFRNSINLNKKIKKDDYKHQGKNTSYNRVVFQIFLLRVNLLKIRILYDWLYTRNNRVLKPSIIKQSIIKRNPYILISPINITIFKKINRQRQQSLILFHSQFNISYSSRNKIIILLHLITRTRIKFSHIHSSHSITMCIRLLIFEYMQ